jgi:hypothetical protein
MKPLSKIFWGLTLAAMVGFKLAQVLVQPSASNAPDAASGQTQAVVFSRVFNSTRYVTPEQMWLMTGAGLVLFGCVIAWGVVSLIERLRRAG